MKVRSLEPERRVSVQILEPRVELGKGAYGVSYLGRLKPKDKPSRQVAVKVFDPRVIEARIDELAIPPRRSHYKKVMRVLEELRPKYPEINIAAQGFYRLNPENSGGALSKPQRVLVSRLYSKNRKSKLIPLSGRTSFYEQKEHQVSLAGNGGFSKAVDFFIELAERGILGHLDAIEALKTKDGYALVIRDIDTLASSLKHADEKHHQPSEWLGSALYYLAAHHSIGTARVAYGIVSREFLNSIKKRVENSKIRGRVKKRILSAFAKIRSAYSDFESMSF